MKHTPGCDEARLGKWPEMWRLSEEQQRAVLDCPHESHDSVRLFLNSTPWRPPWITTEDRYAGGPTMRRDLN